MLTRVRAASPKRFLFTSRPFETRKAKLGPGHPETLKSLGRLACAYGKAGRIADAITLSKQTIKARKARHEAGFPDLPAGKANRTSAYEKAGQVAEAIKLKEQTFKTQQAELGPDHPLTLSSQEVLAMAYINSGRGREAIPHCEHCFEFLKQQLGIRNASSLQALQNLVKAYLLADRAQEAAAILEQTLPTLDQFASRRQRAEQTLPILDQSAESAGRMHNLAFCGEIRSDEWETTRKRLRSFWAGFTIWFIGRQSFLKRSMSVVCGKRWRSWFGFIPHGKNRRLRWRGETRWRSTAALRWPNPAGALCRWMSLLPKNPPSRKNRDLCGARTISVF